jgi:hypothetical protein
MDREEELPLNVKRLFVVFVGTLFFYVTGYGACTALKRRGGAWELTFASSNGVPALIINHPMRLPLPVTLFFPGETPERTDLPITAVFNVPITNRMAFGPVLHVDTTSLPGVVTLNCFGHPVEIFPRALSIDLHEMAWAPGTNLTLSQTTKPPAEKLVPHDQRWKGR